METVTQNVETLFSHLEKFLKTDTIVGEPIVVGDATIIPLITVSFGLGTGTGSGKDDKGNGGGGDGLGAGAKIVPNSILVIKNGEATLLGVKGKSSLSSLVDLVPEMISKINVKTGKDVNSKHSISSPGPEEASELSSEQAE